ncbi:MAG: glycosyltransferase [Burkholderiaceae bacterium]|nr:glycosyltransferase [Burkholderiaceae bacterium]
MAHYNALSSISGALARSGRRLGRCHQNLMSGALRFLWLHFMSTVPLVSIVIPAYNQAEYLEAAIESVLAQDYPALELCVVDDGSTDGTAQVLERYAGRAICLRHANMGQAATLNKGWALCKGSLLGYLSSDDVLNPQAVSTLVRALIDAPTCLVAYPDFDLIDARGIRLRTVLAEDFSLSRLTEELVCLPGPGALFRREVLLGTAGWSSEFRLVPDFEFWLRAAKLGPFLHVPGVLAQYRVHDGSASFRPASSKAAGEIVRAVASFWGEASGAGAARALSNAYLISAKTHALSGRAGQMLGALLQATKLRPLLLLTPRAWRIALSGTYRRLQQRLERFQSRAAH